jgi:hypothetical protein
MASTNRMTEAQQMAHALGTVGGAASCCEQVTSRVQASRKTREDALIFLDWASSI